MRNCSIPLVVTSLAAILYAVGCNPEAPPKGQAGTEKAPAGTSQTSTGKEAGHSHGDAPHGGTLVDWGGGKYHVEFTVDHDKKEATIYVLGEDAKTAAPIKATDGKLVLSINDPSFQVDLKASPQEGDPEGTASRFVGTHEKLGVVQEFAGSIGGEFDGTPYTGDFKEEPHGHK